MSAPTSTTADDNDPASRVRLLLATAWRFIVYLGQRFIADRCSRAAASLAYTSLLAVVPLFTVLFVTMAAFPAFQDWRVAIESFVFRNFVPAFGDQIQLHLGEFTDKARGLRAAGVAVLVITVLALLSTIESTFNVIWGIKRKRPLMVRFVVYWAVLTLGPLLIGAGMVATSYIVSLPLLGAQPGGDLRALLISWFPLLATTLAFVMFFKIIPYRPVSFRHALAGGVVASVLFELAKGGFALYVVKFPSQQAIYGAFATVPIFLLWIYLSWIIVLLGAEITQCLTTFPDSGAGGRRRRSGVDPMFAAYRVLLRLYQAQETGRGLTEKNLLALETRFDYAVINRALERLDRAGWVGRNDTYRWILMRDPARLSLLDLLELTPSFSTLPHVQALMSDAADHALEVRLARFTGRASDTLDVPLAVLFSGSDDDAMDTAPPADASDAVMAVLREGASE
ncbi:MAG: virulence factor BrkB family protein [Gammaproteobacteria bacterium]